MHDRTTLPSAYLHTIDLCLLRYHRERGELQILLHPVSYTHLTLPTKA